MNLDQAVLKLVNVAWANGLFDALMPFVSNLRNFIPVLVLVVAWLALRDGRRGRVTILVLALLITATDQISSSLLKPAFSRPRPCREEAGLSWVVPRARCSSRGSMPSSHAANIAGAAILLGWRYRRWIWLAALTAFLVGYSRVYLGVHYPSDVVAGWVLGALLGLGAALSASRWLDRRRPAPEPAPAGESN